MTDTLWTVLADPHRRAVLDVLRTGERPVNDLVEVTGLTQSATSKHLRVLREAGLVRVRVSAQQRIYALDPRPIAAIDAWLEPYRALWNPSLDALGRYLDATAPDPKET
jgi:DNA-binding transcriptional ArsR family regulator